MKVKKQVVIIQNVDIGSTKALSTFITSFINNLNHLKKFKITGVFSNNINHTNNIKIFETKTQYNKIQDNFKFALKTYSILKSINEKNKIDIIHCFYPNSSLMASYLFKKLINKNVKIIYDVRSPWIENIFQMKHINKAYEPLLKKSIYSSENFLIKEVDKFIFISNGLKDFYFERFDKIKDKEYQILPSAVDTKIFHQIKSNLREKLGISKEEIVLGYVGSIDKSRELTTFLELIFPILIKDKKVKIIFIGDGDDLVELKNKVKQTNLEDRFLFLGKKDHKEIPKYISIFDFGICHLPNIFAYENSFPLKILEYLACDIPVLASDLKAHREISKNLNNVFIYNSQKDIENILKKKIFKRNPALKKYSWNYITKQYEKIWGIKQ